MIGRFLNQIAEPVTSRWLLVVLLAVLILFPWVAGESGRYYTVLLMTVFIFATLGHAWNLLAGFCGLLSFGIQVYVGLGGFTVAILTYYLNVPVWWAMVLSVVGTTAVAWLMAAPLSGQYSKRNTWIGVIIALVLWIIYEIVILYSPGADLFGGAYIRRVIILFGIFLGALPLLKLQGAYFAVATWLIAAAVASIFNEWRVVGAGGGMNISNATTIMGRYYVGLLLLVVATGVVWWLLNSRYGQALTAVRDDEEAATAVGIDIRLIKTVVFLISAPMAGLAAALYYIDAVTITPPDAFHIRWSAYAVFVVVAGGMGTLSGPIIGAIAFIIVQRFLVGIWGGGDLTLGIAAVLLILLLPRGIAGLLGDLRQSAAKSTPKANALPTRLDSAPGAVVAAILVPSSPALHLLPDIAEWKNMRSSISTTAQRISAAGADTLIILSNRGAPKSEGKPAAHLSGDLADPEFATFGNIGFDVQFDLTMAKTLEQAGLRVDAPSRSEAVVDSGAMSILAQINRGNKLPVVIVDMKALTLHEARAVGSKISKAAGDLRRRVAVVGIGGLSGSAHRMDIHNAPGQLASKDDDQFNRQILGWLQSGDETSLQKALAVNSGVIGIENQGAVLMALNALSSGRADVLSYGAIFGAGAAVVEFQTKDVL